MRIRALLAILLLLSGPALAPAAEDTPKIVIVLVDGLSASAVTPESMPAFDALARSEHATRWSEGRSVMPAVTNANHAALLSGTYPDANGITGNYFWSREGAPRSEPLERPEAIEAETIFSVIERERPALVTASITGKAKLERLFGAAAPFQIGPDVHWSDAALGEFPIDGRFGTDERTMTEALRVLDQSKPDLLFVALPEVDLVSHVAGPTSPEAKQAIAGADRQIGRLVDRLRETGTWGRTILFVTADHGFADLTPGPSNPYPVIFFGRELARNGLAERAVVVSDGVLAHVYLRDLAPTASSIGGGALQTARRVTEIARATPEVEAVMTRLPWAEKRAAAPPPLPADWRLDHSRAGDLVLLAKPGHHFLDPFSRRVAGFAGNHGGPRERPIPILVAGGHPALHPGAAQSAAHAENPDIGRTVLELFGLRGPNGRDGKPIPAERCGRVLREALAH